MERDRGTSIEISPEGRIAGWVTAAVFVATAATLLVVWAEPLWRPCREVESPCARRAAAAGLVSIGALVLLVAGIVIPIRLRRRPVTPGGSARYVWWLGSLFALAVCIAAWKIPAFTCERGRFDELLGLCMHPAGSSTRSSPPDRWVAMKDALVGLGLVGGLAIVLVPRWARVTAPVCALTWFGVLAWALGDLTG
jgi:hypothetical protein